MAQGSTRAARFRIEMRQKERARKVERVQATAAFSALGERRPAASAAPPAALRDGSSLLVAPGDSARSAWVSWLAPVFAANDSLYFTGTYSDDYGFENGLTLQRNVFKDFGRFLEEFSFDRRFICGVEQHQYRDILHLHGILEGSFTPAQRLWVKEWWAAKRGHAKALPVLDGCASYVTKYALKGDTDAFEWRLA